MHQTSKSSYREDWGEDYGGLLFSILYNLII